MKIIKDIPKYPYTVEDIFFGDDVLQTKILLTERKITDFWKNLINNKNLESGYQIKTSDNTFITLTKGIEIKDGVRYSSFIQTDNGVEAILHHEYSMENIRDLVHDWLFVFSKEENVEIEKGEIEMAIEIDKLKEMYPKGTVIELDQMDDIQAPPKGTKGTVEQIDDMGGIHVRWENGSGLALIPEEDKFHVVEQQEINKSDIQKNASIVTINNENLGDIDVLAFDLKSNIALINIKKYEQKPYAVVHGLSFENGLWRNGEYFKTKEQAYYCYEKNEYDGFNRHLKYKEGVKFFIQEGMDTICLKITDQEAEDAYNEWINRDEFTTVMDADAIGMIEQMIQIKRYSDPNKKLTMDDSIYWWYKANFPDDELGDEIEKDVTFEDIVLFADNRGAKLDYYRTDDNYICDIIGVRDSVILHRCINGLSIIRDEPYTDSCDVARNYRFDDYEGHWDEIDTYYNEDNDKFYRRFENREQGTVLPFILTDADCEFIGTSWCGDIALAVEDVELLALEALGEEL